LHIAYITHEFPPDTGFGGIGTYTCHIAKMMLALGHTPEVFTASFERDITEVYEDYFVHRVKVKNLKDFKYKVTDKFTEVHKKKPFQLMECPEIGGEAEFIKDKYPAIPLIVRLHTPGVLVTRLQNAYSPLFQKMRFVVGGMIRGKIDFGYWSKHDKNQMSDPDFLITEKAKLITAPSKAMKQWAVKFWQIDPEKIRVIPNPYLPAHDLLNIPIEKTSKRITFVGRLNILKGMVSLTKAIPAVLDKHPDWVFRFIGKNEKSHIPGTNMKNWMQEQLYRHKDAVEFIDWVDNKDLASYYADSEICVFPSLFESFSYVCVEAMSAGRAIVGSEKGGMIELLGEECGLLINPYKFRSISRAINKFIEHPELREKCKENARKRILNSFSAKKSGEKMLKVYNLFAG